MFCSRTRRSSALASGDVTGRWTPVVLNFSARAGETPQAAPSASDKPAQAAMARAVHDLRRMHFNVRDPSCQDTSSSMSLIERSESPGESSKRLQLTSAELPPLAPCRSASRWHLMQYVA